MIFDVEIPFVVRKGAAVAACPFAVRVEAVNPKEAASIVGRKFFGDGTISHWYDGNGVLHEGNDGAALTFPGMPR